MNISEHIKVLKKLLLSSSYRRLNEIERESVKDTIKLLENIYVNRKCRRSESVPIKFNIESLRRVSGESNTRIVLYMMQLNGGKMSFHSARVVLNKQKLWINSAFQSLIKTGMVKRISYGMYELTQKGEKEIV